ncbi:MAG: hypothetical protein Terrestrivirus5_101 [Terrestrivirus sp.]|uniref:Uncharacterized protein n=1 Tax=Terrestrivirus sp. TaxID=2487775 RepID=A0A3G4ZS67_9VIRU|nr:MAG: hypothetical protein Terrestrivirus5_101 [Terrestrivirus sp.]
MDKYNEQNDHDEYSEGFYSTEYHYYNTNSTNNTNNTNNTKISNYTICKSQYDYTTDYNCDKFDDEYIYTNKENHDEYLKTMTENIIESLKTNKYVINKSNTKDRMKIMCWLMEKNNQRPFIVSTTPNIMTEWINISRLEKIDLFCISSPIYLLKKKCYTFNDKYENLLCPFVELYDDGNNDTVTWKNLPSDVVIIFDVRADVLRKKSVTRNCIIKTQEIFNKIIIFDSTYKKNDDEYENFIKELDESHGSILDKDIELIKENYVIEI